MEFALIAPLFILLLSGMMYFGALFATLHGMQQLAAEAARASVAGLSSGERAQLAQAYVARDASAYLLDPEKLVVVAQATAADANAFEVVVRYDVSDQPIFAMADLIRLRTATLERRAVIRRGGY